MRGQVEKCLEPVRLCNYACEIKNDMCQGNLSDIFLKWCFENVVISHYLWAFA